MRIVVTKGRVFSGSLLLILALAAPFAWRGLAVADVDPSQSNTLPAGITISPSQKELSLNSGLISAKTNVTLTNHSGKRLVGTIKLLDFKNLNDTGGLLFTQTGQSTDKYGLANWMSLPNGDTVNIGDGESATLPIVIDNRADLAPGGHYGAMVVTFGTGGADAGGQTNFKQELVSLLFIKKLGGEIFGLQLESLTPYKDGALPSSASLRFNNTGNVHVTPRGYVTLATPHGVIVAKGIINPESQLLLPSVSKAMPVALQTVSAAKDSGTYKLTAYYRYDEQTKFSELSTSVHRKSSTRLLYISVGLTVVAALVVTRVIFVMRRR